jgi:hypothetical protein
MKYQRTIPTAVLLLAWILQCPTVVRAQDPQTEAPPKPAAKAIPPIGAGDDQETDQVPAAWQPDDRPLTGFQELTVGTQAERHSYWILGSSYTNIIRSNSIEDTVASGWNTTSYVAGNFSLLKNWSASQLALNYSGGGAFSTDPAIGNGQIQEFRALQTFDLQRTKLTFLDQFSYLPEGQFGFGAGTSISIPGVGGSLAPALPGLQNSFTPGQSIFSEMGPQYSNSFGAQLNYALTPRGSVTIAGAFSILRFSEAGVIESNTVVLSAGYNYQVSKNDILGVLYRFDGYEFLDSPQALRDHTILMAYGKKITGRLALQLSGGPQITNYRVPPGTDTKTQYISGTGSAGLSYAFEAGSISLGYSHLINSGSGLLYGARSDQLTGNGTRKLSRVWSGNLTLGYTRNSNIAGTAGPQNQAYSALYVGAGLQRPFGRTTSFTMSYTANIETPGNSGCGGTSCDTNYTTHAINIGLSWRTRPFVLQ